jgi:tetratricopeptide (TPR) repeat protein
MKHPLILSSLATLVFFVNPAAAKSPAEIEQIAKSVSVEMITGTGSGVIVHRQSLGGASPGETRYTLITNRHVVCGSGNCKESRLAKISRLRTADRQVHEVSKAAVQLLQDSAGQDLDLAIVQFRSSRSYPVAQIADSNSLRVDDALYTAGFPKDRGFAFGAGQARAVVNKRLAGDRGGYTVVYDADTLPGMSGGGVFDQSGRLLAIHGYGDRFRENTQTEDNAETDTVTTQPEVGSKIGYNRGIPVHWMTQALRQMGIVVGNQSHATNATTNSTADEYFITGFNKLVEPGENILAGKQEAVSLFSQAIALNPRYIIAYFLRAYTYQQLRQKTQALDDYNQVISIAPNLVSAYMNRGSLKRQLNDLNGALADYNKAISLQPNYARAYNNRGLLKFQKLNDDQGALADFNQAIAIEPSNATAYSNRGILKFRKFKDDRGALADFNQAIAIEPNNAMLYKNRGVLKYQKFKDDRGALADFDKAIALNPNYAEAFFNRGLLNDEKFNKPQAALADYDQAIFLNPAYALAYSNRGIVKYEKFQDAPGALADFDKAITLDPNLAIAYMNRGTLRLSDQKLQDRPRAIQDFQAAAKIFRKNGQTQYLQYALDTLRALGATE